MPCYDRRCNICGATQIDLIEPMATPNFPCACGGQMERAWLTKPPSVIGDECDVTINHGLCAMDGSPMRWRSKEAMRKEMKRRGIAPLVRHVGEPGSDKSSKTSRWV